MKTFKQFITEEKDDPFNALQYVSDILSSNIYFAVVNVIVNKVFIRIELLDPEKFVRHVNLYMYPEDEISTVGDENYVKRINFMKKNGGLTYWVPNGPVVLLCLDKQDLFEKLKGVADIFQGKIFKLNSRSHRRGAKKQPTRLKPRRGEKVDDAVWDNALQKAQNDLNNLP